MYKILYFVKTQIWKNFVIIVYIATLFVLQFFSHGRLLETQFQMPTPICIGLIDAVLDPKF